MRPHRRQPTRLPCPWDSPGKNTGVWCHCLLQCMKVKSESEVAQSYPTLSDPIDGSLPGSSAHGIFQQEYWSGVPLPSLVCHCYCNKLPQTQRFESENHSVVSNSFRPHGLYSPWNSPGQNTGVDSLSLLQWTFPTQESNQGLLHHRRILYQLSYQGSPLRGLKTIQMYYVTTLPYSLGVYHSSQFEFTGHKKSRILGSQT